MTTNNTQWNFIQKFLFRFFFIYFLLIIAPWTWIQYIIPWEWSSFILSPWHQAVYKLVQLANDYLFKVYQELVLPNGSGDTSWSWTHFWFFALFSFVVAIVWSVTNRKNLGYPRWNYLLVTIVRYKIAITSFGYGIIKLFALQMPFPSLSQLATPLGEYLPMRFSWMFIGYSTSYQIFSGVSEVIVGLLLFNRKTATAGVLMALAVFTNVMVMNLSYDIPVKLYSTHLVVMSLFLVVQEHKRILAFFVMNKSASPGTIYDITLSKKWQRITRYILKGLFVVFIIIIPFNEAYIRYQSIQNTKDQHPIRSGIYDVTEFVMNNNSIPATFSDSARWNNMIFHPGTTGSLLTSNELFRKAYGRSYFNYFVDTVKQQMTFRRTSDKADSLFTLQYSIPDSSTITLSGIIKRDTLFVRLKRTNKQFRLAEKQFHWLSEYNR